MRWATARKLAAKVLSTPSSSRLIPSGWRTRAFKIPSPTPGVLRKSFLGGSSIVTALVGLSAVAISTTENTLLPSPTAHELLIDKKDGPQDHEGPQRAPKSPDLPYPRLLPKEKTRLLVLAQGQFNDKLEGNLKHVRSLEDHEYEALSYVWGPDPGGFSIRCFGLKLPDGMDVPITPNLDSALRRLRYPDRPRLLWVDAICINQEDVIEKSSQIQGMREIYLNAKEVAIWLGEPEVSVASSFKLLHFWSHRELPPTSNKLGWYRSTNGRVYSGGDHRPIVSDRESLQLVELLNMEWFQRTWIIQEAASSKIATFYCGDQSLKWVSLANAYKKLGDRIWPLHQPQSDTAQRALDIIIAIERSWRTHNGPLEMSLMHILLATSHNACTDDRDKIFAVQGLAKDWKDKHVLHSDYRTSVKDVFTEFAIEDMIFYRDLRILSCVSDSKGKNSDCLPSWVPDWTASRNAHPFVRYRNRTRFRASSNVGAESWHTEGRKKLVVTGKKVDLISEIAMPEQPVHFSKTISAFEINETKIQSLKASRDWILSCYSLAFDGEIIDDKTDPTKHGNQYRKFWRTMLCGLTGDAFPIPDTFSGYFKNYLAFLMNAPETFEDYLGEARGSPVEFKTLDQITPHAATHALVEASLDKWSSKRRFCKTREKRFACVPPNAKPGDVICVLFGAEVPYVLRPLRSTPDTKYTVVGECYVDGIMHGEGLSDDVQAREFHLV